MISVDKISQVIEGNIFGDATLSVHGICNIENGKENCITYLGSDKYKKYSEIFKRIIKRQIYL